VVASSHRSRKNTTPVVSVVIPTYNPGKLLERCLASIPSKGTEVIVVDNGSNDGRVERAKTDFPHARFIFLGRNTGFAFACNRGAELARGKVILFLNQDVEVIEEGYRRALEFLLADKRRGIATGKVTYPDGRPQETIRRFPGYLSFLFGRRAPLRRLFPQARWGRRYMYKDLDTTLPQRIDVCTGMFMLVRTEAFRKLKGLDEGFFFYVEDIDFCKRSADAGWETWFVPQTLALHHVGENIPGIDRTYVKMHHYKGAYRYLVKHKRPGPVLKGLLWLGMELSIIAHLALNRIIR
jgi:N-acetylglucosaminyl-diphospho-decaprenol L-rhamnosyltransferase